MYAYYFFDPSLQKKNLDKFNVKTRYANLGRKTELLHFLSENKNVKYYIKNEPADIEDFNKIFSADSFEAAVVSESEKHLILKIFKMYTLYISSGMYANFATKLEDFFSYFFIEKINEVNKRAEHAISSTYRDC